MLLQGVCICFWHRLLTFEYSQNRNKEDGSRREHKHKERSRSREPDLDTLPKETKKEKKERKRVGAFTICFLITLHSHNFPFAVSHYGSFHTVSPWLSISPQSLNSSFISQNVSYIEILDSCDDIPQPWCTPTFIFILVIHTTLTHVLLPL